ncbi:MAG: hypothetical protein ABSB94_08520 [Syntrophorhabdales bacterium]|jgi:hypothetical protein
MKLLIIGGVAGGATAAARGASEKRLRTHNIPYLVSYTHPGSHASYYPGAAEMAIKLIFDN